MDINEGKSVTQEVQDNLCIRKPMPIVSPHHAASPKVPINYHD